jgi:hypothetical protein
MWWIVDFQFCSVINGWVIKKTDPFLKPIFQILDQNTPQKKTVKCMDFNRLWGSRNISLKLVSPSIPFCWQNLVSTPEEREIKASLKVTQLRQVIIQSCAWLCYVCCKWRFWRQSNTARTRWSLYVILSCFDVDVVHFYENRILV